MENTPTLDSVLGERLSLVRKLRETEKKTFREIGEAIGTSRERAAHIYHRDKELHERYEQGDPFLGLSIRVKNVCRNAGLKNREEIAAAIKNGQLHPKKSLHYGWKSHSEILIWLGLPDKIVPE
jgi:hypothetical protein